MRLLCAFIVVAAGAAGVTAPVRGAGPWPEPDLRHDRLVWVHPLVNYAFDPRWQRAWERELVRSNGARTTVGSVTTDDLMTFVQVNICEPAGERFRFLYRLDWRDAPHADAPVHQHWLGLGVSVLGDVAVELQTHPTADKEDLDLRAGLLVTDADRDRYLRLALRWDDLLYNKKNDRGGVSHEETVGVQWEFRWGTGRWEAASEGFYGSPWSRSYPDSALAPVVAAAAGRRGEGAVRLRRLLGEDTFVEAGVAHHDVRAEQMPRTAEDGDSYTNEWLHVHALAVLELSPRLVLRPEFHWLRQWATGSGSRSFDHRREDIFPAVFLQLRGGRTSTWEFGYMATHYAWTDTGTDTRGFTDKVKVGWIVALAPMARLQLSLSHERDLERFGGANVQFQMLF